MASSKVSCMLVSLLLLVLVLSDMDKALGEPIQLLNRKLKVTEHHDQVTTDRRLAVVSKSLLDKLPQWFRKAQELVGAATGKFPSSPKYCNNNDEACKKKLQALIRAFNAYKAKRISLRQLKVVYEYLLKAKSHPSP